MWTTRRRRSIRRRLAPPLSQNGPTAYGPRPSPKSHTSSITACPLGPFICLSGDSESLGSRSLTGLAFLV